MKNDEFFNIAEQTFKNCFETLKLKNADYSHGEDALKNFKMVEALNLTSIDVGVCVRLCDKFSRISNLLKKEASVKTETIDDTINDAINYLVILKAALVEKETLKVKAK